MSTQPEEVPVEEASFPDIMATGNVTDGIITAESELEGATLVMTYPIGDRGALAADTLYEAFPQVLAQVIAALEKAQAEAEAGA